MAKSKPLDPATSAALEHLKAQGVKLGRPVGKTAPLAAATVARAQELTSQGLTLRAVAEVLTAEGYQTLKGGRWTRWPGPSQVRHGERAGPERRYP